MSKVSNRRIALVLKGYAQAMLWTNASCNVESCEAREIGECKHTLDAHARFGLSDFDSASQDSMREDVVSMVESNVANFEAYCEQRKFESGNGTVEEHFGHDFALTRNGHGAGFWDRGLGALGSQLSNVARPYGESTAYVSTRGASVS